MGNSTRLCPFDNLCSNSPFCSRNDHLKYNQKHRPFYITVTVVFSINFLSRVSHVDRSDDKDLQDLAILRVVWEGIEPSALRD